MSVPKKSISLAPVAPLSGYLREGTLVAFNVGPDGAVYLVLALRPTDYRLTGPGGATYAKITPERQQRYRVLAFAGQWPILDVTVDNEPYNIHHITPLCDEMLLLCSRAGYRGPHDHEKNGRIYSREGLPTREMALGDGIEAVQTTAAGTIWTSYFDEGIFGGDGAIGASGLVAWNATGEKLYEYDPGVMADTMVDCYALNVVNEQDLWCYYYSSFELVHLHQRQVRSVWPVPVRGSHAFAVSGDHALFFGGYKDAQTCQLVRLEDAGKSMVRASIELRGEGGQVLGMQQAVGRGDALHMLGDGMLYALTVREALAI